MEIRLNDVSTLRTPLCRLFASHETLSPKINTVKAMLYCSLFPYRTKISMNEEGGWVHDSLLCECLINLLRLTTLPFQSSVENWIWKSSLAESFSRVHHFKRSTESDKIRAFKNRNCRSKIASETKFEFPFCCPTKLTQFPSPHVPQLI